MKMSSIYLFVLLVLTCYKCAAGSSLPVTVPITAINMTTDQQGACPAQNGSEAARSNIVQNVNDIIRNNANINCPCGGAGDWRRIAYLNMSDPNEQCPSNWRLITSPVRACGHSTNSSCDSALFSSGGRSYSRVCGRIIGYQQGSPSAFESALGGSNIETYYVDGISVTHGSPGSRQHVWTFANALWETDPRYSNPIWLRHVCSCTNTNFEWNLQLPSYIGNDYFCDTSNPGPNWQIPSYYSNSTIWDGEGCGPTNACCEFNNPPWFCKTLPQPTSDNLEIRICHNQDFIDEDSPVHLIDIHVQ